MSARPDDIIALPSDSSDGLSTSIRVLRTCFDNLPGFYSLMHTRLQHMSRPELGILISFILSYPLGIFLQTHRFGSTSRKHAFILGSSLLYLLAVYGNLDAILAMIPMAIVTKVICEKCQNRHMPWIATAVLLSYISVFQLVPRGPPTRLNFLICDNLTKPLTMMFVRLTTFCWNVSDGRSPPDKRSTVSTARGISKFPNTLEYASYVFFFPTLFAESHLDFAEYRRVINVENACVGTSQDREKTSQSKTLSKSLYGSITRLASGMAFEIAFVYLSELFPAEDLFQHDFQSLGPIAQILMLHTVGFWARLRGYGNWRLAEGSLIACGFALQSSDSWGGLANVNPWQVEFATNPRAYVNNYNTSTATWFKNHAYLRLQTSREAAGMITFIYSALWHGFAPGFWVTFVLAGVIQLVGRDLRKRFQKHLQGGAVVRAAYDLLSWFCTHLAFDFAVLPFIVLGWNETLLVWSGLGFHIALFKAVAIFYAIVLLRREISETGKLWSRSVMISKSRGMSTERRLLEKTHKLIAGY